MLIIGLTGSIATGKSTVSRLLSSPPHNLPIIDADLLARQAVEPGTRAYRQIVEYFEPAGGSGEGGGESILMPPPLPIPSSHGEEGGKEKSYHRGESEDQGKGQGDESESESESKSAKRPLDRAALGRRVFGSDPARRRDRAVLNSIVHPAVRWRMYRALLGYFVRGRWAVVLDVPLLFESGLDVLCGTVVVVGIGDVEVQVRRLVERDGGDRKKGLSEEEAWDRVRSQADVRDKAVRCLRRNRPFKATPIPTTTDTDTDTDTRGLVLWNDGSQASLNRDVDDMLARLRQTSPPWWTWALLLLPPLGLLVAGWQVLANLRAKWAWEGEGEMRAVREKGKGKRA